MSAAFLVQSFCGQAAFLPCHIQVRFHKSARRLLLLDHRVPLKRAGRTHPAFLLTARPTQAGFQ